MYFTIEKKLKKYSNTLILGPLAQLVEHFPFKEGVVGSNPTRLTKLFKVARVIKKVKLTLNKKNS